MPYGPARRWAPCTWISEPNGSTKLTGSDTPLSMSVGLDTTLMRGPPRYNDTSFCSTKSSTVKQKRPQSECSEMNTTSLRSLAMRLRATAYSRFALSRSLSRWSPRVDHRPHRADGQRHGVAGAARAQGAARRLVCRARRRRFKASVAIAIFELVLAGTGGQWVYIRGGLTGRTFLDAVVAVRALGDHRERLEANSPTRTGDDTEDTR